MKVVKTSSKTYQYPQTRHVSGIFIRIACTPTKIILQLDSQIPFRIRFKSPFHRHTHTEKVPTYLHLAHGFCRADPFAMAGIARDVLFFLGHASLQTLLDLDHDTLRNTAISCLETRCASPRSRLQAMDIANLGAALLVESNPSAVPNIKSYP